MGAIGVHHTATTEGTWDGPGAEAAMPNDAATLRYCHAWFNTGGDPEAKQSYKFPHHRTEGGPAVMAGVRNALARLAQADIPEGDRAGVQRHLQAHMDDAKQSDAMGDDYELRSFHLVEVRAESGEVPKIYGTAAVYNQATVIETFAGSFSETIEPGFFDDVLGDDVRALWNHNTDLVLGRTKSGTLELQDQAGGLGVKIDPPATQWGRDALTSISRGDVDQMSFAFSVKMNGDEWRETESGLVRVLKRGGCKQLYDVSPVSFPAYPTTSVGVRSKLQESQRDGAGDRNGGGEQGLPTGPEPEPAQGRRRMSILIETLKKYL
jgi:HK97 family phage prohead protease